MNTQPSTPFGIWFAKHGIGKHKYYYGVVDTYESLEDDAKTALQYASGWVAVINANVEESPDFVFELIQKKFPDATKEHITEGLTRLAEALKLVTANIPTSLNDAITALQGYLSKFEGNTWVAIVRAAVTILADIIAGGKSPIQIIEMVLEFVYQTFIKGKVTA